VRLRVKQLEDRTVPSSFTAGTVADLIADINAANTAGGSNTITLVAGTTFTLTAVDNTTDGATGLPVVAANNTLTIVGNSDTIERSTASGTPAFRLFDVASGASLSLENMSVQNGLAHGSGLAAEGGAMLNQGSLTLSGVTVQNNTAQGYTGGYTGGNAAGGGIYSSGSLTVQNSTIQNNQALGGAGASANFFGGGGGGSAFGGGMYISGGTATLTRVTVSSNTARGGDGGRGGCEAGGSGTLRDTPGGAGGNGLGGGLYVAGGTIDVHNDTVSANTAAGGAGGQAGHCGSKGSKFKASNGPTGLAEGGGLYIDPAAAVCLDAFTQGHVQKNHASTSYPDIDGTYTTCP
jgi:hypothetical protein